MDQIKLDKVKQALSLMDDRFWDYVVDRASALQEQTQQLAEAIADTFSSLAAAQLELLEARAKGFKQISENADTSSLAEIIKNNKSLLEPIENRKRQAVSELSNLFSGLEVIIAEMETLGEFKGGRKNEGQRKTSENHP